MHKNRRRAPPERRRGTGHASWVLVADQPQHPKAPYDGSRDCAATAKIPGNLEFQLITPPLPS